MDPKFLDKLACPMCKSELDWNDNLKCHQCEQTYEVLNGIPNFLPKDLFERYNSELKDQDLDEEMAFYEKMYSNLDGLDDGHCVVYGYDEIYDFMSDIPQGSILDIGCGAGHHSKDLALKGHEVYGIDISINGLIQAGKINRSNNLDIKFTLGDIENLPFKNKAFDVVFCSLIIHHFPKKERLLREISRVSKTHVVTFEVNSYDPISFLRFNILNPTLGMSNITKNQRTVSPTELERRLKDLGFSDFQFKFVDVHHNLGRYPNRLSSKMIRAFQTFSKVLPYRCRFNKFLMKCKKSLSTGV